MNFLFDTFLMPIIIFVIIVIFKKISNQLKMIKELAQELNYLKLLYKSLSNQITDSKTTTNEIALNHSEDNEINQTFPAQFKTDNNIDEKIAIEENLSHELSDAIDTIHPTSQVDIENLSSPLTSQPEELSKSLHSPYDNLNDSIDSSEKFESNSTNNWISKSINWFLSGNLPVNIGVLILLIGVGALLRYLINNGIIEISIAIRLGLVGLAGVAGLAVGWKTRKRKPIFGLALQGGSIGVLLLVVFSASKMYYLMPLNIALILTLSLLAFAMFLSIKQNSFTLMCFVICASYSAPLWLSSGSNNFVALFSYYALLNCVVFIIAFLRAWPLLNTISYLFNFTVGTAWAYNAYIPENFFTVQIFIAIFFIFFTLIPYIYSRKYQLSLHKADNTFDLLTAHTYLMMLITPFIIILWEQALINMGLPEFYISDTTLLSAIMFAIAAIKGILAYLTASKTLNKQQSKVYTCIAIGIATVAIPVGFTDDITGLLFIAQGIMFYYFAKSEISIQSKRHLNLAGIIIHAVSFYYTQEILMTTLSNLHFSVEYLNWDESYPSFAIGEMITSLIISLGFALSFYFIRIQTKQLSSDHSSEASFIVLVKKSYLHITGFIGLISIGSLIQLAIPMPYSAEILPIVVISIPVGLYYFNKRIGFNDKDIYSIANQSFLWLIFIFIHNLFTEISPYSMPLFYTFIKLFKLMIVPITGGYLLKLRSQALFSSSDTTHKISFWHVWNQVSLIIIVYMCSLMLMNQILDLFSIYLYSWQFGWYVISFICASIYIWIIVTRPQLSYLKPDHGFALLSITAVWLMIAGTLILNIIVMEGNSSPLPWIILLNPIELPLALLMFCLYLVIGKSLELLNNPLNETKVIKNRKLQLAIISTISIFVLQISLMKAMWHWMMSEQTYWNVIDLLHWPEIQALLTGYWTLVALIFWLVGSRKGHKKIWLIGATIFVIVLGKLILIDRQYLGDLTGIISFIIYGLFCVVIGYFLPIPKEKK